MLTQNEELEKQLAENYKEAEIPEHEMLMLEFVEKLTKEPADMVQADVERLKEAGFSDRDIFYITQVVAYFNYVNRIADGLGIQLEK